MPKLRVSLRALLIAVAVFCAALAWIQPQTLDGYREDWNGTRPKYSAVAFTVWGRPAFGVQSWRARVVFYANGENVLTFTAVF